MNSISCSDQFGECNANLNSELSILLGKDIIDAKADIEKILEDKVYIKSYSIYYNFPDRLEINIIIRKPKYSIFNRENYMMIDNEGTILELKDSSALPTIFHENRFLNVGEQVTSNELFSLELLYDIESIYKIQKAVYNKNKLDLTMIDGRTVILPVEGDKKVLIGSLVLIIDSLNNTEFKSENVENVQIIDLRFKNPVLK